MAFKQIRILSVAFTVSLTATLFFQACAVKEQPMNVNLAGNRKMGVSIRSLKMMDGSTSAQNLKVYFEKLTERTLERTYGSKAVSVPFAGENVPLEDPENLFAIGSREIDDYFLLDVNIRGAFQVPTSGFSERMEDPKPEDLNRGAADQAVEVSGMAYNGSNLRAVTLFKVVVPTLRPETFENLYTYLLKNSLNQALSNPNIYPKSNPEHFGNLLYTFSQAREKDYGDMLDCDRAVEVLKYYPKARELYELANKRGTNKAVGQQSETYQLSQRIEETSAKAKLLDTCMEELKTGFQVSIDYGNITKEGEPLVKQAYDQSELESILKQYTSRPSKLRFQIESNGDLSLFVTLRFDRTKYTGWIKALKIPQKLGPFQIVALDPYKALMQKLVVFRASLPSGAPAVLKNAFSNMRMSIAMNTLQNGEIAFGADGTYMPEKKYVKMKYPNAVVITAPGFPAKSVTTKNDAIFQDKGWIAIGNCKTLDGTLTEDGLLYKFFGLPCQ